MNSFIYSENPNNYPTLREALDLTGGFQPEFEITPELWDLYTKGMSCRVKWFEKIFPVTNTAQLQVRLFYDPVNRLALMELPPWQSANSHWSLLGYDDVLKILQETCGAGKSLNTISTQMEEAFNLFCASCTLVRKTPRPSSDSPMDVTVDLL